MWDLDWPSLPPSLCSRGTPSQGPHSLSLLLSSCFDLAGQNLASLPFCPTSNFFCTAPLSTAPLTPVATAASLCTQVCVCVCVSPHPSVCSAHHKLKITAQPARSLECLSPHIYVLLCQLPNRTERYYLKFVSRYIICFTWMMINEQVFFNTSVHVFPLLCRLTSDKFALFTYSITS